MKVYVVGDHGPEHNSIRSIHKTRKGALKAWDGLRIELLEHAKSFLSKRKEDELFERIVRNLSCKDPEKIDNYTHETPYVQEYEVED